MTVLEDLGAEQERLEGILCGLDEAQWMAPSAAAGWTVTDVVLHLAQSEESVVISVSGGDLRTGIGVAGGGIGGGIGGGAGGGIGGGAGGGVGAGAVEERVAELVRAERAAPDVVFARWRRARRAAMDALRAADPDRPVQWVVGPVKPATLATTRLAEHWAHGLDITGPLGVGFPDTGRLRHVAWLAHRTLPYALALAGEQPAEVRCELTAPDGASVWRFGPPEAESAISGPAGEFCRVGARRLSPAAASGLTASGPHGAAALRVLRTYAA